MPGDPTAKVPDPSGTGIDGYRETITGAANMVGVDPNQLLATAAMESGFKNNAVPGTSSAQGLFQFISSTWSEMIKKYGRKFGIDSNTPPTDPKAASIMGAQFLKDNMAALAGKTRGAIGVTEGYLAHFLGAAGAATFLKARDANPNDIAAAHPDMVKPARSNPTIFFDNGRPRTFGEIYSLLDNRIRTRAKAFGIALGADATNATAGSTDSTYASTAAAQTPDGRAVGASEPLPPGRMRGRVFGSTDAVMGPAASLPGAPDNVYTGRSRGQGTTDSTYSNVPGTSGELSSAYGMTPPSQAAAANPRSAGTIDRSLMTGTENLLTQQLDVQKQILALLTKFSGSNLSSATPASAGSATAQASEPAQSQLAYSVPTAPISMRRAMRA
jgi:hypothetical protein